MAIPDISGLSRAEIEALLDAVEARKLVLDAEATTNAETIRRGISGDVDALVALIGPPVAKATAGTDSIGIADSLARRLRRCPNQANTIGISAPNQASGAASATPR